MLRICSCPVTPAPKCSGTGASFTPSSFRSRAEAALTRTCHILHMHAARRVQEGGACRAGLDAATLFDVVRWLRAMTHHLEMTVIVSLLQPPPETFALFDDLMLMNEGTVVFHGPLQAALPHVQSLGFNIPPRKVRCPTLTGAPAPPLTMTCWSGPFPSFSHGTNRVFRGDVQSIPSFFIAASRN